MTAKADYIAARASESLSYGDIAYAESQGWCPSSPDGMGPHLPDDTTDPVTCAECGATIDCLECGEPLTVEGDGDGTGDPVHLFCDLCSKVEHAADLTTDWNGETGNHLSCERNAR